MQSPVSWQPWLLTLLAVSVLGTFVVGFALILDGWIDALALYVVCVLVLMLLLARFAEQRTPPLIAAPLGDGRADPGGCPSNLMLTRAPGTWAGAEQTAATAALGNAARMD